MNILHLSIGWVKLFQSHLILWSRGVWDGDVQGSLERRHVCDVEGILLKENEKTSITGYNKHYDLFHMMQILITQKIVYTFVC